MHFTFHPLQEKRKVILFLGAAWDVCRIISSKGTFIPSCCMQMQSLELGWWASPGRCDKQQNTYSKPHSSARSPPPPAFYSPTSFVCSEEGSRDPKGEGKVRICDRSPEALAPVTSTGRIFLRTPITVYNYIFQENSQHSSCDEHRLQDISNSWAKLSAFWGRFSLMYPFLDHFLPTTGDRAPWELLCTFQPPLSVQPLNFSIQ